MIPDRDLPHVSGDGCPRCGAHDGEPHGAACVRAREAAEAGDAPSEPRVAFARCGASYVDGDGREVPT